MKIAVAGGDLRMLTVARLFAEKGHECTRIAPDDPGIDLKSAVKSSAAVILPLPCEKGGKLNAPMSNEPPNIGDIFAAGEGNTLFIGGKLPIAGGNAVDYSLREDFLLKNAVPTAEGALEIALRETDITLHGAKSVVIGYGRIGNHLAGMLKALNSSVTVAARRPEIRALAEISGMRTVGMTELADAIAKADIVFNTVPFPVIGKSELCAAGESTPLIDLASLPGGIDKTAAEAQKARVIHALALPGKVAPKTAGRIIFEVAAAILRERGMDV